VGVDIPCIACKKEGGDILKKEEGLQGKKRRNREANFCWPAIPRMNVKIVNAEEVLDSHGLRFNHVLQAFVCRKHGCLLSDDPVNFRRHLRRLHKLPIPETSRLQVYAESVATTTGARPTTAANYREGTTKLNHSLPAIRGLPIFFGQQCPTCHRVYKAGNSFRSHLGTYPCGDRNSLAGVVKKVARVRCQTLKLQRRTLFIVDETHKEGEK